MTGGEQIDGLQRMACKALIARLKRTCELLAKMNLATLDNCQRFRPNGFDQLHLHIGVSFREIVQELRNNAFNELWGGCHLQDAGVTAPEQARPLAERAGVVQQNTAVVEQLLTFARQ